MAAVAHSTGTVKPMRFRPCIDLHGGAVKQIVGASLTEDGRGLRTNFVSPHSPAYYADLYFRDGLRGAHVILLGGGNEAAAKSALAAHPDFLQVGGGVTPENAQAWLEAGAAQVIVTSYLFPDGDFSAERLRRLAASVRRERLVLDLSCLRLPDGAYAVACDRWQRVTSLRLSREVFARLGETCCEFLIHAVAVEGRQGGIDSELVARLPEWCDGFPVTYAGGIRSLADVEELERRGSGQIDFTVGSALDLFGGKGLRYQELLRWGGRAR